MSRDEHRLKIRHVTVNDAEALASMMARSESGWPWSISGGVPLTARTAREHIETQATLGHFVAEIGGRLVGVCEVYPGIREPRTAYVGFLNVEPAFQGRGIGRRLLRAAVDRAIEEGVDRIDIDTWGGNLKALPLYKKMGFFWVPETSVHMVNFIPIVLRHPMFREFFERHPDWYQAQVRDLSATEDLAEKDGVRIYRYVFKANGDEVETVFDRNGLWLTGGGNSEIEVWIHPKEELVPDGFPVGIQWEIRNKTSSRMEVALLVRAPSSVNVLKPPPEVVEIPAFEQVKVEGVVAVDPKSEIREPWEEPERMETILVLGGRSMGFKTGLRREEALSFEFEPSIFTGRPGAQVVVHLRLRNRTKLCLMGRIEASPESELVSISPRHPSFRLEPESHCGMDWTIQIDENAPTSYLPIVFQPTFAREGEIKGREKVFHLGCLQRGEVLAYVEQGGRALHIENGPLHVTIDLRSGGRVSIADSTSGELLVHGPASDALGPPFWPTEFDKARCEYTLQRREGSVLAKVTMKSKLHPGLALFKEIAVASGSPLIAIRYGLMNSSPRARSFKLKTNAYASLTRARIILPTRSGLISEDTWTSTGYPIWGDDAPRRPKDYAENWVAFEGHKGRLFTVGSIWPRGEGDIDLAQGRLAIPKLNLRAGARSTVTTPAFYIYVSEGTWLGLREAWNKLAKKAIPRKTRHLEIQTRRPLDFQLLGGYLGPSQAPLRGDLEVSNLRGKRESGSVRVNPPKGWRARPSRLTFKDLSWGRRRRTVVLLPPAATQPGVYEATLVMQTREERRSKSLPIFLLGDGRIQVRGHKERGRKVLVVSNGVMEYRFCPSFGGTVYSLKRDGVEFLSSPFPREKPMIQFNPWFGGLSAPVGTNEPRGWRESFTARQIQRGIWRGIESACTAGKHVKELKGLVFRSRYLLAPSLNIMRIEQEIENPTTTRLPVTWSATLFPGLGPDEDTQPVTPDEQGHPYRAPLSEHPRHFTSTEGWLAVSNTKLDKSLILAGPTGPRAYLSIYEMRGLRVMNGRLWSHLDPGQSSTWTWHLAVCSADLDDVSVHRHIRELSPRSETLY